MIKTRLTSNSRKIGTYHDWYANTHDRVDQLLYGDDGWVDTTNHGNWRRQDDASGYFASYEGYLYRVPSDAVNIQNHNGILGYSGQLTAPYYWPGHAALSNAAHLGATAYDAMKPTKPMTNAFNPLYELRELPHMIANVDQAFRNSLSGYGDLFLSQIFGWIPIVSDLIKLVETQQGLQKRIEWLLRNEGKWVSRRVKLHEDIYTIVETDWQEAYASFEQSFTNSHYLSVPQSKVKATASDTAWATAQFRYFLPTPPPGVKINHVLKMALNGNNSITLANLYKAVPWTWFIDWAFRASKVLEALNDGVADRLAARRFCIMREIKNKALVEARGTFRGVDGSTVTAFAQTATQSRSRTRVLGSPFYPPIGEDLSSMQYAILGALGASNFLK